MRTHIVVAHAESARDLRHVQQATRLIHAGQSREDTLGDRVGQGLDVRVTAGLE